MQEKKIGIKIFGTNSNDGLKELNKLLQYLQRLGFQFIEMRPDEFDLIIYGDVNWPFLNKLKSVIDNYDFEIVIHAPLRLNLFNREFAMIHEKVFEASLEICKFFKSKKFVIHPGRYVDNNEFPRFGKPKVNEKEKNELMTYEREKILKYSDKYKDIEITLENQRPYLDYAPYSYAEFIDELVMQVKLINRDNVFIALDTGHLNLSSKYHGFNLVESLKSVKCLTKHVHLQDNHGIVNFYTEKDKSEMLPFGRGDEHLMPGEGNFPFLDFFEIFNDYKETYTIELSMRYMNEEKILSSFNKVKSMLGVKNE